MILAVLVSSFYLTWAMRKQEMVPGRVQASAEMLYEFVSEMVKSNVGNEGRPTSLYFHAVHFLLFGNMLGLIPYSYTFTSQIVVTFVLALYLHRCDAGRADQTWNTFLQLLCAARCAEGPDPVPHHH